MNAEHPHLPGQSPFIPERNTDRASSADGPALTVVFVNSTHKWGGVKTWCLDIGDAMRGMGHRVWIVGRAGAFLDKAASRGLATLPVHFGPDFNPFAILKFLAFFLRVRPDFVVVNVSKDVRTAGTAARMLGIPLIHRIGAPKDMNDGWKTRLTQRLLGMRLLACSKFVRNRMRKRIPVLARADFAAIHPGVRIPEGPTPPSRSPRVILASSQLNPDKGHGELLDALARLRDAGRDFRCIILGTGSAEAALKEQCSRLGLDGRVDWRGFVTDVPRHLHEADVFVLPTFCEPLGIALEEAMAGGLVPIARHAGGVPEIWPPELGMLCFPREMGVNGLVAALEQTLTVDDEQLAAWKNVAKEHARRTFDVDGQCRKVLAWMRQEA